MSEQLDRELDRLISQTKDIAVKRRAIETAVEQSKATIAALEKQVLHVSASREDLKAAIDLVYNKDIKELQDLLNIVVHQVFHDQDYSVRLDLSDKYNKSISWYLYDNRLGREISVNRGIGKGVATVISFAIYIHCLLKFDCKYLFVDEAFHKISVDYVDEFVEFVKTVCKEKGFTVVSISHDDRFKHHADKLYRVADGVITEDIKSVI